jgi:hypothetical protein
LTLKLDYSGVSCDTIPTNDCYALLPINSLSLNVDKAPDHNALVWTTITTTPIHRFEVERSNSVMQWESIGEVPAIAGILREQEYGYRDYDWIPGNAYYRVKAVGEDATYKYSNVVSVSREPEPGVALFNVRPNPARNLVEFDYLSTGNEANLQVTDGVGVVQMKVKLEPSDKVISSRLDIAGLPAGAYFIHLTGSGGDIQTTRFVKQ